MSFEVLGFLLDVFVLVCLGATIFFALRLSKSLNNFKAYRDEFNNLVKTLSQNIDQAQRAVINLKAGSHETADELNDLIKKARAMRDELQLINEAGNSLAVRLEGLAQKSGRAFEPASSSSDPWFDDEDEDIEEFMEAAEDDLPFSIHDPDFSEKPARENVSDKTFQSQAERELYQALMGKRKAG